MSKPNPKSKFSRRLRIWRVSSDLSQTDAASFIGVNQYTYRNWEYGRNEPASYVCSVIMKKLEN